jgi:hypothetical protein
MREQVVLPLVPVTATVVTLSERRDSRSGQSFCAALPGKAVPPRCRSRDPVRSSLQTQIAKSARDDIFMDFLLIPKRVYYSMRSLM